MNEKYKFSTTRESVESSKLSKNEIKTINDLGLTVEDLNKLLVGPHFAEGSYALIFDLPNDGSEQKIAMKAWKNPDVNPERAKHENATLRLLRMRKSREAPRLAGYLKSSAILFEEKIEGVPIENVDKIIVGQLAEILAKIHSIELNAYGKPLAKRKKGSQMDYLNDEIGKLNESLISISNSQETMSSVEQAIFKIKSEAVKKSDAFQGDKFNLIHFDLNRNNILQSNNSNEIILIDWEQASAGDNAMDVAKMFLKLNFDEEQKKDFLADYKKNLSKKDEYLEDRLDVYEPLVLINSILWRLRVLSNPPSQEYSKAEKIFYVRVKKGFDSEINNLQEFLNNK